jgi:putative acetyltransferase
MNIRPVQPADNAPLAEMIRTVFHEYNAPRQGTVYSDPTTDHLYDLFCTPGSFVDVLLMLER